jgi:hypothetical protein
MPETMIERVARALCAALNAHPDERIVLPSSFQTSAPSDPAPALRTQAQWEMFVPHVTAILTAMREPTDDLAEAALSAWREGIGPVDLYKIMIDAALAGPAYPRATPC